MPRGFFIYFIYNLRETDTPLIMSVNIVRKVSSPYQFTRERRKIVAVPFDTIEGPL